MRLQIFLSHSGCCSRRRALQLIKAGCVRVNNLPISEPSFEINPERDDVTLNRKKIILPEKTYLVLNKPAGFVVTKKDRFADRTIMELLPNKFKHLNPVGRLDKNTTGILLFTNDGNLAFRLTHPRFHITKTYIVNLDRKLQDEDKNLLEKV